MWFVGAHSVVAGQEERLLLCHDQLRVTPSLPSFNVTSISAGLTLFFENKCHWYELRVEPSQMRGESMVFESTQVTRSTWIFVKT